LTLMQRNSPDALFCRRTIVMDRLMFLEEHDSIKTADIVVGWDYHVSPRNLVLVAEKR
jgi:hypothetical protein